MELIDVIRARNEWATANGRQPQCVFLNRADATAIADTVRPLFDAASFAVLASVPDDHARQGMKWREDATLPAGELRFE